MTITVTHEIKKGIYSGDQVFSNIIRDINNFGGAAYKYNFVIKISYNEGGEVSTARNFITIIENAILTYGNLSFDLRFGGYAISAAAFIFCYFNYYTNTQRVRISSGTRLCIVYHKPRIKIQYPNSTFLIFNNDSNAKKRISIPQRQSLLDMTQEFDDVLQAFVAQYNKAGARTGLKFDQHLLESYNTNGDLSFTLSPQVFKGFYT